MGTFRVSVGIGNPNGTSLLEVDALVDTGATHSMIPESVLNELGIEPYEERPVGFANGQTAKQPIGKMRVVYGGSSMKEGNGSVRFSSARRDTTSWVQLRWKPLGW